jgi:AcrR family transcriptional regulator
MSRRSKQETRQALLDAGMAQLDREGLQVGTQHVRLPAIASDMSMSAGAAYYAFPDGQEEYQQALWIEMARRATMRPQSVHLEIGARLLAAGAGIDEVMRVLGTDHSNLDGDDFWRVLLAIAAAGDNDRADGARDIVTDDIATGHASVSAAYMRVFELFERELIPPYTIDDLTVAIACLADGFRLRRNFQRLLTERVVLRRNEVGELQPWSLFACTAQAIVSQFSRPCRDVAEETDSSLIERAAKVTLVASAVEDELSAMEERLRSARQRLHSARDAS